VAEPHHTSCGFGQVGGSAMLRVELAFAEAHMTLSASSHPPDNRCMLDHDADRLLLSIRSTIFDQGKDQMQKLAAHGSARLPFVQWMAMYRPLQESIEP
jgi:hypothetical protein